VPVAIGVSGLLNESVDALAQMRRAADAGAVAIALDDFEHPVRDVGARTLFMNALSGSVLAPGRHVRVAAAAPAPSPAPNRAPAAASTGGTLTVFQNGRPTTMTLYAVKANGDGNQPPLPLPPPPAAVTKVEEGTGKLIPPGPRRAASPERWRRRRRARVNPKRRRWTRCAWRPTKSPPRRPRPPPRRRLPPRRPRASSRGAKCSNNCWAIPCSNGRAPLRTFGPTISLSITCAKRSSNISKRAGAPDTGCPTPPPDATPSPTPSRRANC